jgi:AraC-like DNA-binding protein
MKYFFTRWAELSPALRIYGMALHERMRPGIVERRRESRRHLLMFFHTDALIGAGSDLPRTFHANSLVLWPAGCQEFYGHPRQSWSHSWIVFDGAAASSLLRTQSIPLATVIENADASTMEHYLLCLHRELANRTRPNPVIIKNTFENWFHELKRGCKDDPPAHIAPRRYLLLKRELEEHYDRDQSLGTLSAKLHVSRWHLCREFKRNFGMSPIDCLIRSRLQHAAQLLRDRNLNISEIARLAGYEDVFHFSKQFKKNYGVSPRKMRNSM